MSRRAAGWAGCAVTAAVIIGFLVYSAVVGLTKAGAVATVVGLPIGIIGIAAALWGLVPRAGAAAKDSSGKGGFSPIVTAGRDAYTSAGDMVVNQPPSPPDK
jgi:hypothetical protein